LLFRMTATGLPAAILGKLSIWCLFIFTYSHRRHVNSHQSLLHLATTFGHKIYYLVVPPEHEILGLLEIADF
jgi:hypothetical protein